MTYPAENDVPEVDDFDYTTADLQERHCDRHWRRGRRPSRGNQVRLAVKIIFWFSVIQVLWLLALGWSPWR